MRDPVPLVQPRDPIELALARDLLSGSGIVYSLRQPTTSLADVGFGTGDFLPALLLVDRTDLERARRVLAEAWGAPPAAPP